MKLGNVADILEIVSALDAAKRGDLAPLIASAENFGIQLVGRELEPGAHAELKCELARLANAAFQGKNFVLQMESEGSTIQVFICTRATPKTLEGNTA